MFETHHIQEKVKTAAANMGLPKVGQNCRVEHLEFY